LKGRVFLAISFIALLSSCSPSIEEQKNRQIQKMEHGLLEDLSDPPWKTMGLLERMNYHEVPGVSIAFINEYKIEWARGYGVLEAGGDQAVTPETLFQTASIAKPVVAAAALGYVERGILALDRDVNLDLVSWHIPENAFTAHENVTLRRLLSHTAGVIIHGFIGYKQGERIPNLQQILNGEPPANSPAIVVDMVPGTRWRYSGGGYMIVQQLLEDITGDPFALIMEQDVLSPLGMTASTFEAPLPERFWPNAASGHRADGDAIPGGWHTYPEMGAGGSLWSTASEMANFAIELMLSFTGESEELLTHEMANEMFGDTGLGIALGDEGGSRFYFFHDGANDGYKSVMVGYPQRGQGVIILTNGDNGDKLWREILNGLTVQYGWVQDRTSWYVGIAVLMLLSLVSLIVIRKIRTKRAS
jgi:CubicO group peptidase (beta-lactamase class C family)